MGHYTYIENGSITDVQGIKAAGIHCGLKKKRKDLALIYSELPADAAGTFTLNKVKAPPLIYSQKLITSKKKVKAVLINSGNANAATGKQGFDNAVKSAELIANKLNISPEETLVSSTGVIGKQMDMEVLSKGISEIVPQLTNNGGIEAAEAIMTTDTFKKHFALKINFDDGSTANIGGICKGSGMIMPNMATMLAFIATDLIIPQELLQSILSKCVSNSFNKISVDGETSTNDMVILLANGASGIAIEDDVDKLNLFEDALQDLTKKMAKSIISDGEGATKVVRVQILNAKDKDSADKAAKAVVNSPLVKTAIAGADANWGRILSAIGNSGIQFNPDSAEIYFDNLKILESGYRSYFSEEEAKNILDKKEFTISIDLHEGNEQTEWWTTDFTEEYIKINAYYRT